MTADSGEVGSASPNGGRSSTRQTPFTDNSRDLWLLDGVDQGRLRTDFTVRWDKASGEPFPAGQSWLADCVAAVAGPFLDAIDAHPIAQHPRLARRREPFGEPGSPWAHVRIEKLRSTALLPLSPRSLDKAMGAYADPQVRSTSIHLLILDDRGYPGLPRLMIGWETLLGGEDLVTFFVELRDVPGVASTYRADLDAWLGVTRRYAESLAPLWGAVALDSEGTRTAFEVAAGRGSRDVLTSGLARGMSWITVLDNSRVALVGGVQHLRETGAFAHVHETADGGVWLQATERPADYGPPEWLKVHRALREALPTSPLWGPEMRHFHRTLQLVPTLAALDEA